ncbi:MAG: hypothetical protein C5B49_07825 [Bdellovibrio sp.]|nr:MAG: hypothetical protein C5B49_07825 [Bdellovibrio sp.]
MQGANGQMGFVFGKMGVVVLRIFGLRVFGDGRLFIFSFSFSFFFFFFFFFFFKTGVRPLGDLIGTE